MRIEYINILLRIVPGTCLLTAITAIIWPGDGLLLILSSLCILAGIGGGVVT